MRPIAPLLLVLLVLPFAALHAADSAPARPNIVLILLDDFGYECVSANGGESYRTPALDQLAASGARFEHCYAQPLCTPTRTQLMTGIGNRRNYTRFAHLDPSQKTFANLLKKAGYETCVVGKWQLGNGFEGPAQFGFDEYCLWQLNRRPGRYKNPGLEINGKQSDYSQNEYGPDIVNDYALDFIARKKDKPFCLYYPMMLTHNPYEPTPDSPDYLAASQAAKSKPHAHFADMVAYADKLIGKLVARLDELHLRENTLILILGDNGTGRGTPSQFKGHNVVGGKGTTTTWGTRVPAIFNWPGHIPKGRVSSDLIDSTDFLPTLCEATSTPIPTNWNPDGQSFLPQLRGEKGQPREWLYSWYNPDGGKNAKAEFVHNAKFKLYSDGRFYHVEKDDNESTPIAAANLTPEMKMAKSQFEEALKKNATPRPKALVNQREPPAEKPKAKRPNTNSEVEKPSPKE